MRLLEAWAVMATLLSTVLAVPGLKEQGELAVRQFMVMVLLAALTVVLAMLKSPLDETALLFRVIVVLDTVQVIRPPTVRLKLLPPVSRELPVTMKAMSPVVDLVVRSP